MPAWFGDNLIGMKIPQFRDQRFAANVPTSGDVLVVLLRADCEHCLAVSKNWRKSDVDSRDGLALIGVSVGTSRWVVMPGSVSAVPLGEENEFAIAWQSAEEPFVAAPTFLAVHDQIVVAVVSGDDASKLVESNDWINQLFGPAERQRGRQ